MTTKTHETNQIKINENDENPIVLSVDTSKDKNEWNIEVGEAVKTCILLKTDFQNKEIDTNTNVTIHLQREAEVSFVTLCENGNNSNRKEKINIHLNESSEFLGAMLTTHCKTSLIEAQADFNAENARCELAGLTIVSHESKTETNTVMNHHLPENTSRQLFKNILNGSAQTRYVGLVFVEKDAQKTDSEQSNQNILLSNQANSIAEPQLKIHADDVIAAHGSTTGQLDESALYYIQSRGLPIEEARRALLYGFAEDLLTRVSHEEIKETLEKEIESALEKVLQNV